MIRFLMYLFGKTDYEPCKGCEVLRAELERSSIEKKELYETLLKLVKPEVIHTAAPTLVTPQKHFATFSQRRSHLEEGLKVSKEVRERSAFIAKPSTDLGTIPNEKVDSPKVVSDETVTEMEARLGLVSEVNEDASKVS